MRICHKAQPSDGSGRSKTRLDANSHVEPVQILDEFAACLATRDANFAFCLNVTRILHYCRTIALGVDVY